MKMSENEDCFGTVLPSWQDNILQFNQYMKLAKMPYIIYAKIESFI